VIALLLLATIKDLLLTALLWIAAARSSPVHPAEAVSGWADASLRIVRG